MFSSKFRDIVRMLSPLYIEQVFKMIGDWLQSSNKGKYMTTPTLTSILDAIRKDQVFWLQQRKDSLKKNSATAKYCSIITELQIMLFLYHWHIRQLKLGCFIKRI